MADKPRGRLKPRKPGPLSERDKRTIEYLQLTHPDISPAGIAKIVRKSKIPVVQYLHAARLALQERAPMYAELHARGAAVAAAKGDTRPAEWALQSITATSRVASPTGEMDPSTGSVRMVDGPEVRIVTPPTSQAVESKGLTVNIGLAIGNLPAAKPSPLLAIEGTAIAVTDSSEST